MCEFKVIKKNNNSQIGEDIIILGYTEENELVFRDILGTGTKLDSALMLEVNTISQTTVILEHPLIKDFIGLMKNLIDKKATTTQVENVQSQLDELKSSL